MKSLRLSAIAAAATLFVAVPSIAQAPISQGRTSNMTQLQSNTAELRVKVIDLEAENARLYGEIESLQFRLNQSLETIERMQNDDVELANQLKTLNGRISQLGRRVKALENAPRSPGSSTNADVSDGSARTSKAVRRTVTTSPSGPRKITGAGSTRTVTSNDTSDFGEAPSDQAQTSSNGGDERRIVTTGTQPAQTGSLGTLPASNLPGAAGPLFAEAKLRLTQFDHAGAEEAFRAFLDQFAEDPQAGEAQYWLGETLYQQGAYGEAGAAYTSMIQNYPNDMRAPDALVKLARAMRLVGESERACTALAALPERYPDASAVTKNLAAVEATRASCG